MSKKAKKYTVTVKLGKEPTPVELRLGAIRLRGIADKLAELAESAEGKPL